MLFVWWQEVLISFGDMEIKKDRPGQVLPVEPLMCRESTIDDLLFLDTWDKGLAPWPSSVLRIRQLYRANPALARAAGYSSSRE